MAQDRKRSLRTIFLVLFFIIIGIYAFLRSYDLVFGVKIKNVNLRDGEKMVSSVVEIAGNAKNATLLTLNGREISVDQNGNFKESVALTHGYNVINIKAIDKFGNTDEENYQLIY